MLYVLTPEEMRAADAAVIAVSSEDALMRTAGVFVAERIRALAATGTRVVAFAGPGNNGGDAFAALAELGGDFEGIVYSVPSQRVSGARAAAELRAHKSGVSVRPMPATDEEAEAALEGAVGVDALFGTGARLPIPGVYLAAARALDASRHPVVAIDIPSGVDALTGAIADVAVKASVTVTLGAAKPGLLVDPARERCGELWCADIGIDAATLAAHARGFAALDDDAFEALLPVRAVSADKRSAGAPLVIAGSSQFPGAAVLCTKSAARAGAGYVTLASPSSVASILRGHLVEQVVVELQDSSSPREIVEMLLDLSKHNSAVAIGPGLGLDERTGAIVCDFLARNELPVVVDASALFHLAKRLDVLRGKAAVVTPHAGEFARLSGKGTIAPGERVERVREFVARTGIATLLKGRDTLICDGTTVHVNVTGTDALATAGSGDVLTGVIGTLLAQGLTPVDAARAGAYWHGLAGQFAASKRPVGVVAGDLPECLAPSIPGRDATVRAPFLYTEREGLWRIY
ncbi:MAG: NAD(P)H-hydrate dehydratase [Candidatus Eremiobacteraeota bacterium]|nr:NAD(P)H-hydrate dehydratase [Candidatus Eremiobacteraeota bacterium]